MILMLSGDIVDETPLAMHQTWIKRRETEDAGVMDLAYWLFRLGKAPSATVNTHGRRARASTHQVVP